MTGSMLITLVQGALSLASVGCSSALVVVMWRDRRDAGAVDQAEAEVLKERLRTALAIWVVACVALAINWVQYGPLGGWSAVAVAVLGTCGRIVLVILPWKRLRSRQRLRRLVRGV